MRDDRRLLDGSLSSAQRHAQLGGHQAVIRILVAVDHALFLATLGDTLGAVPDFEVVATVSRRDGILAAAQRTMPTVGVLNTGIGGVEVAADLRHQLPHCAIVLIMAEPSRMLVDRAVRAGVLSVIPKQASLPDLVNSVRGVSAGFLTIHPALLGPSSLGRPVLSEREREVLRLSATGASVKDIAAALFLAVGTVRNVASAAIRKTGGRNRFDAALIASEQGWL